MHYAPYPANEFSSGCFRPDNQAAIAIDPNSAVSV